jgi:glycosyltransferase involved in cell wall biosynthesis
MNILLVAPMPPQSEAPGAIPLVLYAELLGLMPRHTITLVTVAGPDPNEWAALDHLQSIGIDVQAVRRSEPSGFARWQRRWRWAGTWLRGKYPWRTIWFWEPELQRILNHLLVERSFDLIIVEDNAMGIYRYCTQTPLIFTEHEVRRPRSIDWRAGSPSSWLRWAFRETDWSRWRRYQSSVWHRFDRIQVFTPRDADAVIALAPDLSERVRVNPFGVDLPAPIDYALEEKGNVLFVGNFTHPPNVDAALWLGHEIMPLLRVRYPGVRLTLVGIYPPQSVQALACDDIVVTGSVPEIEPFFERAAVILAPLRIGGGMRMKVLQAMALGKAVVTTPRGADGLTIDGQQPPLIVAESAEEIADATASLLNSSDTRQSLGHRAHAFVSENFSAQAYARRIEAAYVELQSRQKTLGSL